MIKQPPSSGQTIFQIRRCTPDILALRKKKKAELEKQQKLQSIQSQPNLQPTQPVSSTNKQHQIVNNNNMNQNPIQSQQKQIHHQLSNQATQSMHNFQTNFNQNNKMADFTDSNNLNMMTNELVNNSTKLPFLIELNPEGYELPTPRIIQIKSDFYEIGNDKYLASTHPINYIRLDSNLPGIERKHCALKKSNDNLQLLLVPFAETYVNDRLIKEPTQLFTNCTIRLGKFALFRLENPNEINNMVIANDNRNLNNNINNNNNNNNIIKPLVSASMTQINNINKPQQQIPPVQNIPANYGTLYDGQITNDIPQPQQQPQQVIPPPNNPQQISNQPNLNKPSEGLPGLLEFPDDGEDSLLAQICTTNQTQYQFKLAPVYTMYMMLRYRLSQKYKPELTFFDKLQSVSLLIHKMVNYIREAVDQNHLDKFVLPYWLANSSELLYFLKQDTHLSQISYDAQELLADCVQITFKYLVNIMQMQLDTVLGSFFDPSDHIEDLQDNQDDMNNLNGIQRPTLKHVINVLNETMNLLRGSRVNAALTIQLFSQLFHYVSMWLFNRLVKDRSGLCSRYWGDKLSRRLNKIQIWAEKQGLELAADCHLSRIIQASFFLQTPKNDIKDLSTISSNCFALNSLQIKCLLQNYLLAPNEPQLSSQLCHNLISIAENTADEVLKQEGRLVQLEEEVDLQLPFLLPEDGHSCEFIKGLPAGLLDFLENLQNAGHCWLWQNTQGPGSWKKFMNNKDGSSVNTPTSPTMGFSTNMSINNSAPQTTINNQIVTPNINNNLGNLSAPSQMINQNNNPNTTPVIQNNIIQNPTQNNMIPPTSPYKASNNNIQQNQQMVQEDNQFMNNFNNNLHSKPPVPPSSLQQQQTLVQQQPQQTQPLQQQQPVVIKLRLNKKNGGLGLSIVAARGPNQQNTGIYVKSVVPGGAADDDGRLNAGDQLLGVDENSLINVTQERAAELMTKSGPVVLLTVAKDAATFHNLDALLNKSPINNAVSMPSLQQQQQQNQQPQFQPNNFTTATLPRNHFTNNNNNEVTDGGIINSSRARSMSQELLRMNSNNNSNSSPIKSVLKQSPQNFNSNHHVPAQRGLPNEQQIRYSSERPVSMHSNQMMNYPMNGQNNMNIMPRQLPNEFIPRYGSERPTSVLSSISNHQYRLNSLGNGESPSKQQNNMNKMRQASLSELDEINYSNGKQSNIIELQQQNKFDDLYGKVNANRINQNQNQNNQFIMSNQQNFTKTLPNRNNLNNNNNNNNNNQLFQNNNINGQMMSLDDQQRTKSVGQLYEQIWANNQMNQNNNNNNRFEQQPSQKFEYNAQPASIDDLNLRQLDLNRNNKYDFTDTTAMIQQNVKINPNNGTSRSNIMMQAQQTNVRVIPINRVNINNEDNANMIQRNYENQIVNHNQNMQHQQRQQPPPVLAKPVIPNKPILNNPSLTNLNRMMINNNNMQNGDNFNHNNHHQNNWEIEQLNRQRQEEELRLSLLQQRIELLEELESKPNRTNEEENKLNKLRTEIEFDKRVLEMNDMNGGGNGYLDETNEENDLIDYSPEVRERLANQMRDELIARRRVFENQSVQSQTQMQQPIKYRDYRMDQNRFEIEDLKKRQSEEADRLVEMKREEMRLRKHIDLTNVMQKKLSNSNIQTVNFNGDENDNDDNNREDNEIVPSSSSSSRTNDNFETTSSSQMKPQKHVQFHDMSPPGKSLSSSNLNNIMGNGLYKSNTISSDELNSNSSQSPPPSHAPPPIPVQPPPASLPNKRVMFQNLDFEPQNNMNNPPTPSVIGANEVYVDKRLKIKQQQQHEQQMANMFIEGEKLSFKDKMKLFAKQSGEISDMENNKFKVSRKQREIESKFESK